MSTSGSCLNGGLAAGRDPAPGRGMAGMQRSWGARRGAARRSDADPHPPAPRRRQMSGHGGGTPGLVIKASPACRPLLPARARLSAGCTAPGIVGPADLAIPVRMFRSATAMILVDLLAALVAQ